MNQEALRQTQAALDPTRLTTTVAQVRRWAEVGTHPNWIWAAYADVAQRLTRVEDRLAEMADSLRMMLGQQAALECQDHEPSKEPPMETDRSWPQRCLMALLPFQEPCADVISLQ